ncbi:MAG: hypothetical protein RLN69_15975 [Woeseiaceae bacterium]
MKIAGQALAYVVFAASLGVLSVFPELRLLQTSEAMLSLTFSHAGQRMGECRQLTQEELDALPPNMRRPADCPRERHPVFVRLRANGHLEFEDTLPPSGLWNDGKSNLYKRLKIDAGDYTLDIGMNDSGGTSQMDSENTFIVSVRPGDNLVIGFNTAEREFFLTRSSDR